MATPINEPTTINGQTFYSRPCRCEDTCGKYNSALTLPVNLTIGGLRVGATERLNPCTHGGGLACSDYVRIISNAIFQNKGVR